MSAVLSAVVSAVAKIKELPIKTTDMFGVFHPSYRHQFHHTLAHDPHTIMQKLVY